MKFCRIFLFILYFNFAQGNARDRSLTADDEEKDYNMNKGIVPAAEASVSTMPVPSSTVATPIVVRKIGGRSMSMKGRGMETKPNDASEPAPAAEGNPAPDQSQPSPPNPSEAAKTDSAPANENAVQAKQSGKPEGNSTSLWSSWPRKRKPYTAHITSKLSPAHPHQNSPRIPNMREDCYALYHERQHSVPSYCVPYFKVWDAEVLHERRGGYPYPYHYW